MPAVIDERWAGRIAELLRLAPRLLGTSVFEMLVAEGYSGSYASVTRHLHAIRGPRFHGAPLASTRIETGPGEERQFDWSDVSAWTSEWGLGEVWRFASICAGRGWHLVVRPGHRPRAHRPRPGPLLRVHRWRAQGLADRSHGALGKSQGRRFSLHPPATAFAQFCGNEIRACQAADAKRKGREEVGKGRVKTL